MAKPMLIAVAAGLLSLMAALPALQGSPGGLMLFYIAGLPIYLAGFAYGAAVGTVASISSFLAAAAMGGVLLAGVFALVHLLPAWTVIRQAMIQRPGPDGAMHWQPPGPILGSLTMIAGGLLILTGVSLAAEGQPLSELITTRLTAILAALLPQADEAVRANLVSTYGPLLPASAGSSWIVMATVSAAVAQGILAKFGKSHRPTPNYAQMVLPDWLSWGLVAAALVALIGSGEPQFIARNLALVMTVPFLMLGLAVIHGWARSQRHTGVILVAVYLFIFLSGWVGLLVAAAVGVLEQWAGLRHRIAGPQSGNTPNDDE